MSRYHENKARARTENKDPTMTDQSAATDTDINVIVARYAVQGTVPGAKTEPIFGDMTQQPRDLRETLELARSMRQHMSQLPPELRGMPVNELLGMTPGQIAAKLKKEETPTPTPAPTETK